MSNTKNEQLIVRPAELPEYGIATSTGWAYAKDPDNDFPSPRKFGPNVTGWLRDELLDWARSREPLYVKKKANMAGG